MGRRADSAGTARLAIVGAQSPEGSALRDALAEFGMPGPRVDLFGLTHGETVLSEYAGEARLIQDPRPEDLCGYEVVVLCEAGEKAGAMLASCGDRTGIIDMCGAFADRDDIPVVHLGLNPEAARGCRRVAVPHALSALLAVVLHPLHERFGIREASAVLLRPASDFGKPGMDELREQTVQLLNFGSVPEEVFGRQLCFNVIPQHLTDPEPGGPDRRLAREVARILSWPDRRLSVRLVTVPVFHGHSACIRVVPEHEVDLDVVRDSLSSAAGLGAFTSDAPGTPMEAASSGQAAVSHVENDGMGGYWLWVVAGEAIRAPAEQALRLAGLLADL